MIETLIVILIITAALFFVVRFIVKASKGKGSCGCGCGNCGHHCDCNKDENKS